jgi:hypothetical protein
MAAEAAVLLFPPWSAMERPPPAKIRATAFIGIAPLTPAVPEPSTWAMTLGGFAGLGWLARMRRRKSWPAWRGVSSALTMIAARALPSQRGGHRQPLRLGLDWRDRRLRL